jgi:type II secretory pathway pseudopilin PulG
LTRAAAGDIRARRASPRFVELLIVASVIALIAAAFLHQMLWYAEQAEKAAVEQVRSAVNAGLQFRVAELLVKGREAEIRALADANPMDWLERKPSSYVGAVDATPGDDVAPPGSWYFDRVTRHLVYRVVRTRHLESPADGILRFRVFMNDGELPGGEMLAEPLRGVRRAEFAATTPYRWFEEN